MLIVRCKCKNCLHNGLESEFRVEIIDEKGDKCWNEFECPICSSQNIESFQDEAMEYEERLIEIYNEIG